MNKMTWLDLYNYLYTQANLNVGGFDWSSPVMVHDASTGNEYNCDTWLIANRKGQKKVVLATNIESIFEENKKGKS